jgi:hypothetical protein
MLGFVRSVLLLICRPRVQSTTVKLLSWQAFVTPKRILTKPEQKSVYTDLRLLLVVRFCLGFKGVYVRLAEAACESAH